MEHADGKNPRAWWGHLREWAVQVLFPEGAVCLGCGKVSDGEALCPACRAELKNGEMLDSWEREEIAGVPAWSIRPHRGLARTLVLRLKHGAERRAAAELTGLLRDRPEVFPAFPAETVVTWVPMPKNRRRERAVDHGRLLAEGVAAELGLSCRALIIRRKSAPPQARLNRAGRERNLQNTFAPGEKITFPVLLVDDVLTTGTTARRCIEALRAAGAKEMTVLTMTRAART
ncbi:MAG: ComF family protein [Clostridia bacterium]|nr:ComF family protein [Clostridia bacterium]